MLKTCYQLMRTDDPSLFSAWMAAWKDLGEFEIVPVRTSAEAAQVIAPRLEGLPAAVETPPARTS